MRRSPVRFSRSEALNRTLSLVDFITTTFESRFSVHTPPCAPVGKNTLTKRPENIGPICAEQIRSSANILKPGGGRSRSRTRLQPREFPANREINREFRRIPPRGAILKADTRANSEPCTEIPLLSRTGNCCEGTGNFCQGTGILHAANREFQPPSHDHPPTEVFDRRILSTVRAANCGVPSPSS